MKIEHKNRIHRKARGAVRGRASGWCDWWITDNLGCVLKHPTLTVSGMEPSREKARSMAAAAAREFNLTYQEPPAVPVARSEIKPSCARCEVAAPPAQHRRLAA